MIYSKASLAVSMLSDCRGVLFEKDGAVIAMNERCIVAVSPCSQTGNTGVPNQISPGSGGYFLGSSFVQKLYRSCVRAVAMCRHDDAVLVGFSFADKHRDVVSLGGAPLPIETKTRSWRDVLRRVIPRRGVRVCFGLRDLISLLDVIERVCPDVANSNPVFIEIDDRGISLRSKNLTTGQHVIATLARYDTKGVWLECLPWEKALTVCTLRKRSVLHD